MKLFLALLGLVAISWAADPTTAPTTTVQTTPRSGKINIPPNNNDQWPKVLNQYNVGPDGGPYCIKLQASIRLELTFNGSETTDKGKPKDTTVNIFVPSQNSPDFDGVSGSCDYDITGATTTAAPTQSTGNATEQSTQKAMEMAETKNPFENAQFQRLEIMFYQSWKLGLTFTKNTTAGGKSGKAFILYSVDLTAELSRDLFNQTFDNSTNQQLQAPFAKTNITANGNADYWKAISASSGHSEKCLHIQTVKVQEDRLNVDFVNMTVQAFAWSKDFMDDESCPQEVPFDDTIDIVIGAIMSGVVTIVMIIYLIYRLKKGPSKIPKHLMPKPPKTSISTVDGGTANSGFTPDKM